MSSPSRRNSHYGATRLAGSQNGFTWRRIALRSGRDERRQTAQTQISKDGRAKFPGAVAPGTPARSLPGQMGRSGLVQVGYRAGRRNGASLRRVHRSQPAAGRRTEVPALPPASFQVQRTLPGQMAKLGLGQTGCRVGPGDGSEQGTHPAGSAIDTCPQVAPPQEVSGQASPDHNRLAMGGGQPGPAERG